ncbi:MAG: DNA translocase FtsK [Bacteroidota bacterium]|nr:DNA translocase FtsK [Bacteroidota bacterium]
MVKKKLKLKKSTKINLKKVLDIINDKSNQKIFATFLLLFSVLTIIAFISYLFNWKVDDSILSNKDYSITKDQTNNQIGGIGAKISYVLIKLWFGISAIIVPTLTSFISLNILGLKINKISKIIFHGILLLIILPIMISHFIGSSFYAGGIGVYCSKFLIQILGEVGTTLTLLTSALLYLIMSFKLNSEKIVDAIKSLKSKNNKASNDLTEKNKIAIEEFEDEKDIQTITEKNTEKIKTNENEKEIESIKTETNINVEIVNTKNEKILSDNDIQNKLKELGDFDPTLELSKYKMPTMNLLKDYGDSRIAIDRNELEKNKNKIVETLGHYKIGISSISATVGPTITLYEIVPEAGIRISKIKNLEDDISLSLSAEGIRIIAPIPGRGTIGIEVPNEKKNTVSMLEVLQSDNFQNSEMELPIAFGKTISNETFVIDLAKMPHLLMAGATGQGKSVGLNAMLVSLLYKKHPAQIKFVLVDPKKVELTLFNKIERHYLAKLPDAEEAIITDTKKVVNTVNSLCIEMDQRYELCKLANCRNIKEYNKKFISRKLNPNKGHRYLPYIVLVIDEFADLIMTAGKEIETPIARLAQLARAIGIHLIVATQRPSVNVITGLIKANFPARVAFRVTSSVDSRTIMDTKGAEQLIGMGDMLISTGNEISRLQCAFVDTPEVENICEFIGSQRAYPDAHMLPEFEGETEASGTKADLDDKDEMFDQAAEIVVKHQSGSTSLIQRKLRLGYNRAGRIIDQLEAAEIVGPFEGSKARKVLIKNEQDLIELLQNLKNNE